MHINTDSVATFCLGLASHAERWQPTQIRMQRVLPQTRMVFGYDAYSPETTILFSRQDSRLSRVGEAGCLLGHAEIWRIILEEQLPEAIVIEDDVFPHREFSNRLEVTRFPDTANLIFLGSNWCAPAAKRPKREPFDLAGWNHLGSFAYWIPLQTVAHALADFNKGNISIPVDNYLSQQLRAVLPEIYVCNPSLIIPEVTTSLIRRGSNRARFTLRSGWQFEDYIET